MIYALWEIFIPLLIAFLLGVLVGWVMWRWRRTKVTSTEWNNIQERAVAGDRVAQDTWVAGFTSTERGSGSGDEDRIRALTADLDVRNIEIDQLRAANAEHRAHIERTEAGIVAALRVDDTQARAVEDGPA